MTKSDNPVLVVDDDPITTDLLARALAKLECSALVARDGQEALRILADAEQLPVGVLTDLQMPHMDGLTLLRTLSENYPNLPTAVLTGHGSIDATIQALQSGAVDFLLKPATENALRSLIGRFNDLYSRYTASLAATGSLHEKSARYVVRSAREVTRRLSRIVTSELLTWIAREPLKAIQLQMVLIEALENALVHGNLGVASDSRETDYNAYLQEIEARLAEPARQDRTITVEVTLKAHQLEITVEDQGEGFDPGAVPDLAELDVLQAHGRGIFLIRNFFDAVSWDKDGRLIRMHKRLH